MLVCLKKLCHYFIEHEPQDVLCNSSNFILIEIYCYEENHYPAFHFIFKVYPNAMFPITMRPQKLLVFEKRTGNKSHIIPVFLKNEVVTKVSVNLLPELSGFWSFLEAILEISSFTFQTQLNSILQYSECGCQDP